MHPLWCEGGISCEKTHCGGDVVTDWTHEGRETAWYARDKRVTLGLVRSDGFSEGGYRRGRTEVEMSVADLSVMDDRGNLPEVILELDSGQIQRLIDFLIEYRDLTANLHDAGAAFDMPSAELPRRHGGMTKAEEVWNMLELGADAAIHLGQSRRD